MKLIAESINLGFTINQKLQITFIANKNDLSEIQKLKESTEKGKVLDVEVKIHRKKRSNDANGMLWAMCNQIAYDLKTTKEEVYRRAIREVGVFEIVPIKNEAVERWIVCWKEKGIGWFAEALHDSKLPGYTNVISYYGSSVYDTKEMSVLLDHIITDAKEAGIEVMTESEKNLLLQEWGNRKN